MRRWQRVSRIETLLTSQGYDITIRRLNVNAFMAEWFRVEIIPFVIESLQEV